MRALKNFLKLKKGYCERQACRCLTINMRRDYESLPEVCWCWGNNSNSITPVSVVTYTIEKEAESNSTLYTVSMKTNWELTESYTLTLNYNDQDELDTAVITNWKTEKNIQNSENALWLALYAEEGLIDNSKTETAFEQFKEFYNSL